MKTNNTENIIKVLKKENTNVIKYNKYDGITIECYTPSDIDCKDDMIKIANTLSKNNIQFSMERNDNNKNIFIVQFPELEPEYTEKQMEKMYKDIFKWLLDNVYENDMMKKVTKELILQYKDIYVKQAITMYYKSNYNQYRVKQMDLLNDNDYKIKVSDYFKTYVEEYHNKQ